MKYHRKQLLSSVGRNSVLITAVQRCGRGKCSRLYSDNAVPAQSKLFWCCSFVYWVWYDCLSGPYFTLLCCIWTRGSFFKVFPRLIWGCGTSLIRRLLPKIAEPLVVRVAFCSVQPGKGIWEYMDVPVGRIKEHRRRTYCYGASGRWDLFICFFRLQKPSQYRNHYGNNSNFSCSASSGRVWGFACTSQHSSWQPEKGKALYGHWVVVGQI